MCDLRVATILWSTTRKYAGWRLCTTRQRSLKSGPSTIAGDVLEDGLSAGVAWTFVTQVWAGMVATFEQPATDSRTNMLCFDTFIDSSRHAQWLEFALRSLSFNRFSFTGAAPLATLMSTTIEGSFAAFKAFGWFNLSRMTHCIEIIATTSAGDLYSQKARPTFTGMADLRAKMTTGEGLLAPLVTIRYWVFAGCS